jgi:hypothetical protein
MRNFRPHRSKESWNVGPDDYRQRKFDPAFREDIVIANDTAIVTDGYPPESTGVDR